MGELKQFFPQPAGNENGADLSLQTDLRPASPDCFHSEMLYFADPDTCGADGFHEQGQAFPALAAGGREKAGILAAGQFSAVFPEHAPLDAQRLYPAPVPAKKREKTV